MDSQTTRRRTFQLLADALEYPRPGLADVVRECAALLTADSLAAAACMHEFGAFVEETPQGRLEEVYTGTFDLNAACYPYVGYHLFGESYQRSVFMLGLNERYRAHGFPEGGLRSPEGRLRPIIAGELPDHLAVLLRFLAACDDAALSEEIVQEAMLPALDHMDLWGTETTVPCPESCRGGMAPPLQSMADERQDRARQGYRLVLQALHLVLQQFPADNLQQETAPMKDTLLFATENEQIAKKISMKTECCQHSWRRLKVILKNVAGRKANAQRGKELWLAGYRR